MKRLRYSFGSTPEGLVLQRLRKTANPYEMSLTGLDAKVVTKAVNVGIDSYLTAITFENEPSWNGHRLNLSIAPEGMLVLLRRLFDGTGLDTTSGDEESESDEYETALSLRSSILETLQIEEI